MPTNKLKRTLPATADDWRKAARRVIALFEDPGVPDCLTTPLMIALEEAARQKGISVWKPAKDDTEQYDPVAVAYLFSVTPLLDLNPSPQQRVIAATAELLNNPQTPNDLYEHVAQFITEVSSQGDEPYFLHTKPVLAELFKTFPADETQGAIIAARTN